jgi:hypothetical protein
VPSAGASFFAYFFSVEISKSFGGTGAAGLAFDLKGLIKMQKATDLQICCPYTL